MQRKSGFSFRLFVLWDSFYKMYKCIVQHSGCINSIGVTRVCVHFQVCQIVPMPAHHFPVGSSMTTLHLCSDGTYLYWVWSPASLNEKTQKGHSVFMDVFHLLVSISCPAVYSPFT